MATQTNAQTTVTAIGQREDLTDIVALIDPTDTPFVSAIGKGKPAKAYSHEWQTQALATPSKTNFQLEGDDNVSAAAPTNRVRLKNICAISKKTGSVSESVQAVQIAGIADELDEQKMLKGLELRRDMEVILLDNNAYVQATTTGTARECAGLSAYITNTDMTGSNNYTAAAGTGADAWNLANTTSRALSLTIMNGAVETCFNAGGKPTLALFSTRMKTAFSNLTLQSSLGGAAQVRVNYSGPKAAALMTAVDTWVSNFTTFAAVCNVQMSSDSGTTNGLDDTVFFVDPTKAGVSYLRGIQEVDLAKTGDADKFHVVAEYTLQVDAPKAHAALFALT